MVAGGRERDVAVAGFLLGGGTSLYTCRWGFGCDQVVNFEVVLADGRIIEANRHDHDDLFKVLKGGGNNFGIVTRFDMQAFPASPNGIWDAVVTYPAEATDDVLAAHLDFTKGLNIKNDAHLLPFVSAETQVESAVSDFGNTVVRFNQIAAAGDHCYIDAPRWFRRQRVPRKVQDNSWLPNCEGRSHNGSQENGNTGDTSRRVSDLDNGGSTFSTD